jgi:hypothetical protein
MFLADHFGFAQHGVRGFEATFTPLTIRICKWLAIGGVACILIPLIRRRERLFSGMH